MTDPATGALALGPVRGALETLQQLLRLPDLATDMVLVQGNTRDSPGKRATYRAMFATLGRARRTVLWVPGSFDARFERDVQGAYGTSSVPPRTRIMEGVLLLTPGTRPEELSPAETAILAELAHRFNPRLAARTERPAVYLVRDRGGPEWLEL